MRKIEALKALLVNYFEEEIPEDFEELVEISGFRFYYNNFEYIILNKQEIDSQFNEVSKEEVEFVKEKFNNSFYSDLSKYINWEKYQSDIESDYDFTYVFGTDEEYVINEYIILV